MIDPTDLDGTFAAWAAVAGSTIEAHRARSARLAANYYAAFRTLEVGARVGRVDPRLALDLSTRRAATSLSVTGRVMVKSAMSRGVDLTAAAELGEASSARAAARLALEGGRQTIVDTAAEDPAAQGIARACSSTACDYCAGLAGVIFRDDEAASFDAHDSCHCGPEPQLGDNPIPPPAPRRTDADDGDDSGGRRLNAGDLTLDQGQAVAAAAARAARGEISPAEYRAAVRDITGTDSRGRPR